MLNIYDVTEAILEYLDTAIPQDVIEQAVPNPDQVLRDSKGRIKNYVAVQFGDLQVRETGNNLAGVRYSDYDLPIYAQVIAGTPQIAREIAYKKVLDALTGMDFQWTGEVRKRSGGAMWPLISSNGATEAYMFPVSFGVTVQMTDL